MNYVEKKFEVNFRSTCHVDAEVFCNWGDTILLNDGWVVKVGGEPSRARVHVGMVRLRELARTPRLEIVRMNHKLVASFGVRDIALVFSES